MARGTAIETSIPDAYYDPAIGEDIESELPADDSAVQLPADEAAAESRALRMGWTPFSDYRGDPSKWRPASEWLQRAEEMLPIARATNHALERKLEQQGAVIDSMRRTMEEQKTVLEDMRNLARTADQRGYERALAEIKKKQREAVAAGDTDQYDQLVEQAETLEETHAEIAATQTWIVEPAPKLNGAAPVMPEITAFIRENPWFETDAFLSNQMVAKHSAVIRDMASGKLTQMPVADQLDIALQRLREEFPESFGAAPAPRRLAPQPQRRPQRAASVATPSGSDAPQPRQTQSAINSIADPAERAACRDAYAKMKRQIPDYTEREYMDVYSNPHADILDVQREIRKPNGR